MKITDLHIVDPRQNGAMRDPSIDLRVDEPVNEVGMHIYSDLSEERHEVQYAIIPCGPFYAVEVCGFDEGSVWCDLDDDPRGSYGELNRLNLIAGKQLFPVEVFAPDGISAPLAMEVTRLRRLIRKHEYSYVLQVDEQAAVQGKLQWRLECDPPMCYGGALTNSGVACLYDPKTTVLWKDTHLPLCNMHLDIYQGLRRELRVAN